MGRVDQVVRSKKLSRSSRKILKKSDFQNHFTFFKSTIQIKNRDTLTHWLPVNILGKIFIAYLDNDPLTITDPLVTWPLPYQF